MKILITGGCGYVGTMLTLELLLKGYKVRVLDNLHYDQSAFLWFFQSPNYEFIKGDIRNAVDVEKALEGVDFIIHLAGIVGMPACRANPELADEVNVIGTKTVNRMRKNIPLIYASTISLYGMTDKVCDESDSIDPTSVYGETKGLGEKEVMESGDAISLRFATAFGFSIQRREGYMIINDFVKEAIMNNQLVIYDKDFKRSFVHINDIVDSYLFALKNYEKMKGQIYNIGSENMNFSKEEIALKIKEKYFYEIFFKEGKDEDKRSYFVSYDKIRKLGFETSISLDQGLNELIAGYKILKQLNL